MFSKVTATLSEGESELDIPETYINVKEVLYKLSDEEKYTPMERRRLDQLKYRTTTGVPYFYAVTSTKIYFDKVANQDIDLILIVATSDVESLSLTTEFSFSPEIRALVHDGLLYEAYMYRERPDLANAAINSFMATLQKIEEMYNEDQVGSMIWQEEEWPYIL